MGSFTAYVNPKPRKEKVRIETFTILDGDSEFD